MTVLAFDTHAQVKQLVKTGVPEAQAEAIVGIVVGATVLPDVSLLATKAELAATRNDIALLESNLRGEIKAMKGELIWWILGAVGFTALFPQVLLHLPK